MLQFPKIPTALETFSTDFMCSKKFSFSSIITPYRYLVFDTVFMVPEGLADIKTYRRGIILIGSNK